MHHSLCSLLSSAIIRPRSCLCLTRLATEHDLDHNVIVLCRLCRLYLHLWLWHTFLSSLVLSKVRLRSFSFFDEILWLLLLALHHLLFTTFNSIFELGLDVLYHLRLWLMVFGLKVVLFYRVTLRLIGSTFLLLRACRLDIDKLLVLCETCRLENDLTYWSVLVCD